MKITQHRRVLQAIFSPRENSPIGRRTPATGGTAMHGRRLAMAGACGIFLGTNGLGAAAEPRPSAPSLKGGVIAVWLGDRTMDRDAILKLPVVKGGQVVVQCTEK